MKKIILTLITLSNLVAAIAQVTTLPTSWNCNSSTPPNGWTASSGTSQYASSGNNGTAAFKLSATGQYLQISFSDDPGSLSYYIKANTASGAAYTGTFDVQESVNGTTWTNIVSHTGANTSINAYTQNTVTCTATSRFVRFFFTNKAAGNIGLDDINLGVAAAGPNPEINVMVGTTNIINNTSYAIGSAVSATTPIVFSIGNLGTLNPLVIANVAVTGANSSEFVINGSAPTSVAAGASQNLTIDFTPTAAGTRNATLTITNNDANESSYVINLVGYGNSSATEPTAQPSAISFSNIASFKYKVSVGAASPAAEGYIVLRSIGSAVSTAPSDGSVYMKGDAIGNAKVVAVGSSIADFIPSFIVANTAYHFSVYSYNGTGAFINYLQASPATGTVTTSATTFDTPNYYNGINATASTFLTDLHAKINPHTSLYYSDYDDNMVNQFESRDTTGDQKVITCVYSGENKVYAPPFDWTGAGFSREHSYCHSWMPSYPADAPELPEYDDYHHLFPTNLNDANVPRSNYAEGDVTGTVIYSYLQCKKGFNSIGQTVFEPRASHKGDFARALMYMAVCYNTVNNHTWQFPPNSQQTLIQDQNLVKRWHYQDLPDNWEIARNDFIDSIQHNRNPFIDHPEYACYIDFSNMTYISNPPIPCGTLGVKENNGNGKGDLGIFPNPNNGTFNLLFNGANGTALLQIVDIAGRVVSEKQVAIHEGANMISINEDFSKGAYTVKLSNKAINYTSKLIVE